MGQDEAYRTEYLVKGQFVQNLSYENKQVCGLKLA